MMDTPHIMPELGPRITFFTGGSALRCLSQVLPEYTHNSVHLVTPFDSGGSSALLRRCIGMPAVGDLRNRLLALADTQVVPRSVLDVCAHRLPREGEQEALFQRLYAIASHKDPIWQDVPRLFGEVLRVYLRYFLELVPSGFDPRGANLGNLCIAGGYLHNGRQLGPVLLFLSRLLRVRGTVLPIVPDSLHLAAELAEGSLLLGQHRITGKDTPGITAPVRRLFLTEARPDDTAEMALNLAVTPPVSRIAATYLAAADLICYPMGSFWTSVTANLLPSGVGSVVAAAACPKVYIPNTGTDPEQLGMSVADCVAVLLQTLRRDAGGETPARHLLGTVLLDTRSGKYPGGIDHESIIAQGVAVQDMDLMTHDTATHDARKVAAALVEMAETTGALRL